jgi:hypothetical protein
MFVPTESREMIEMRQLAIVALPLIERQLGYIARIVDDLVDVASVTSGRLSLTNLLDNAVKYSEPCGRISVAVER